MAKVCNPIYDTVFKYLVEDERVAKVLLGGILNKKIEHVEIKGHECEYHSENTLKFLRFDIAADYVLIVLMNQGLWAAAMASCISMTVGAVWSLMPFLRKKLPLKFVRGRLTFRQLMPIAANGSSEFFVSIAGSLFAVIVNVVLLRLGGSTAAVIIVKKALKNIENVDLKLVTK